MDDIVIVNNHDFGINTYSSKSFDDINFGIVYSKYENDSSEIISSEYKQKIKYEKISTKAIIDRYMKDNNSRKHKYYRCWILPNGTIYVQNMTDQHILNHGGLVDIFFRGLEKYNEALYIYMMNLYQSYCGNAISYTDVEESFAVEILGWMQVSSNEYKYVMYRGENWQDRLLGPFLTDYNFSFLISRDKYCQNSKFFLLYDNIDEIIDLGLQNSKNLSLKN